MTGSARKFLFSLFLLLVGGGVIGWIYGSVERGLLVAALLALAWHVRHLLAFVQALRTGNFDIFREGEGIWQQIYSQFNYERQRADGYKQRHRQLLREVRKSTNAMPDGAVILDINNEIVMCNRAAKLLAGLKRKKDRGQRVDNILRDPGLTQILQSDDFTREIEIASPIQDNHWLNCRIVPYGAEQKLLLIRDVTERIMTSKMRRDFVANASHELRSPLTVINGYLDALAEDENVPTDWNQPVQQMRAQAQRMNKIVAELLELSRLESAGAADLGEAVDVGGILSATRKAFYQPGRTPAIEVEIESPARLRGNASEIESLATNLVSNAVRHTGVDGHIVMTWRADANGATLVVEDDGEGIDSEHLPRLTERFFRVDRGRSRDEGGVGLGLAIVKHVLGRHDATLEIDSQLGEGSRFSCHFPSSRIVTRSPVELAGNRQSV